MVPREKVKRPLRSENGGTGTVPKKEEDIGHDKTCTPKKEIILKGPPKSWKKENKKYLECQEAYEPRGGEITWLVRNLRGGPRKSSEHLRRGENRVVA